MYLILASRDILLQCYTGIFSYTVEIHCYIIVVTYVCTSTDTLLHCYTINNSVYSRDTQLLCIY